MRITKKDVELTANQLCGSSDKYISKEEGIKYLRRLTLPIKDKELCFEDEFLAGEGGELNKKFWSKKSSSRLAFDLYSWLIKDENVVTLEFEKILPGVISSNNPKFRTPDMDVFFKTKEDIVFIESKFLEPFEGLFYMSGEKATLKPSYWKKDADGKYGGRYIGQRFYNQEDIGNLFSDFCFDIQTAISTSKYLNDIKSWRWFNVKQETTHLFGIIFNLLDAKEDGTCHKRTIDINNEEKNIHFFNVIYPMRGDKIESLNEDTTCLPGYFRKKAKLLMTKIGFKNFTYDFKSVLSLLKCSNFYGCDFTTAKAFGTSLTLQEQMKQYEWAKQMERKTKKSQ